MSDTLAKQLAMRTAVRKKDKPPRTPPPVQEVVVEQVPKRIGRPSGKTPEMMEAVLLRVSSGRSLASVGNDEDMPDVRTLHRWIAEDERFRQAYTRACANRSLVYADTIGDIAKGVLAGKIDPNAARVAIDSYKWLAARLQSGLYGERSEVNVNHSHTLHLDALRQLAEEAKANKPPLIDVTAQKVLPIEKDGPIDETEMVP
jgi:hypothetical protein